MASSGWDAVWVTIGTRQHHAVLIEEDGDGRKKVKWSTTTHTEWLDADVIVSRELGGRRARRRSTVGITAAAAAATTTTATTSGATVAPVEKEKDTNSTATNPTSKPKETAKPAAVDELIPTAASAITTTANAISPVSTSSSAGPPLQGELSDRQLKVKEAEVVLAIAAVEEEQRKEGIGQKVKFAAEYVQNDCLADKTRHSQVELDSKPSPPKKSRTAREASTGSSSASMATPTTTYRLVATMTPATVTPTPTAEVTLCPRVSVGKPPAGFGDSDSDDEDELEVVFDKNMPTLKCTPYKTLGMKSSSNINSTAASSIKTTTKKKKTNRSAERVHTPKRSPSMLKGIFYGQMQGAVKFVDGLVGTSPQAKCMMPKIKAKPLFSPLVKTDAQVAEEKRFHQFGKHFTTIMLLDDGVLPEDNLWSGINDSIRNGNDNGNDCKLFTNTEVDKYVRRLCDEEKAMTSEGFLYSV